MGGCWFAAEHFVMHQQGGWEMVSHHIAGTLSLVAALFTGQAHFYTLMLLATEVRAAVHRSLS